jgi:hypothetical protein
MGHVLTTQELFAQALIALFVDISRDPSLELTKEEVSDVEKDSSTVQKRLDKEGTAFVTEVLPKFGKAIERSVEVGEESIPSHFAFWKPLKDGTPIFLKTLVKRVFGSNVQQATSAFGHIRQICFLFYKYELPYSAEKAQEVIDSFQETEKYLSYGHTVDSDSLFDRASDLFSHVFSGIDLVNIEGRHGPGAVSTGEVGNAKWNFSRIYDSVHQQYPAYSYYPIGSIRSNGRCYSLAANVLDYKSYERIAVPTAKVVLVPKDSRGPRLISMEPLELQFLQQGVMKNIVAHVESDPMTRGKVNFSDQSVNGDLALLSSETRTHATLDLKDASDRVSVQLVSALLKDRVKLAKLLALRSHFTVCDGKLISLNKFAPMGSALCFPVLALVVWALAASAVEGSGGRIGDVYVFGDDLIVPTECVHRVVEALTSADLAVNTGKSFWKGFFRESCGVDAYKGVNVSPVRIKKLMPERISNDQALVAWIKYSDHLRAKGYDNLSFFVREIVERITGELPDCPYDLGFLSFKGDWRFSKGTRFRHDRSGLKVWCLARKSFVKNDPLENYSRVFWSVTANHGKERRKLDPDQRSTGGTLVYRWVELSAHWTLCEFLLHCASQDA